MNKQEAKQKLHNIAFAKMNTRPDDLKLADVMQVIDQIDEPQKPVIPKYVAEWIEETKRVYNLYGAMGRIKDNLAPSEILKWFDTNPKLTGEILARAWLDGYVIEQEKLYTVEIPNPNRTTEPIIYLSRDEGGKIFLNNWFLHVSQNWKNQPHARLTEAEIKQDFEWAWPWAKEVEELK